MPAPLITRSTLAIQARRALLDLLLGGVIPPGERINESRLAEELGISRTPIREALAGLARDGFLVGEPGRGYTVTPLTQDEANELYPILGTLEGAAVRMSTVAEGDLRDLEQLNARFAQVGGDSEAAIALNFDWHQRLIACCTNKRLAAMVAGLWTQVRRYEYGFFSPGTDRVHQSVALHEGILDALRTGDLEEAAQRMEAHWLTDLDQLLPRMAGSERTRAGRG